MSEKKIDILAVERKKEAQQTGRSAMCQCQTLAQEGAVAVVAEGVKEPVDLEDDKDEDNEEEEAEVAFPVLLEQGKEVAAEASRASSST